MLITSSAKIKFQIFGLWYLIYWNQSMLIILIIWKVANDYLFFAFFGRKCIFFCFTQYTYNIIIIKQTFTFRDVFSPPLVPNSLNKTFFFFLLMLLFSDISLTKQCTTIKYVQKKTHSLHWWGPDMLAFPIKMQRYSLFAI